MRLRSLPFIFLAIPVVGLAQSAPKPPCAYGGAGSDWIAACTRVITSGTLSTAELAEAFNARGFAWAVKGDEDWESRFDDAIADYSEAIRLNPQYTLAFHNRGLAWMAKRDYDRAIGDFNEAIRIDPKDGEALYKRGFSWFTKGDYDRAIADYNEVIRLYPEWSVGHWALVGRGSAWRAKGDHLQAIADFTEEMRINQYDNSGLLARADTWFEMGDYDRAIADYSEAIEPAPSPRTSRFRGAIGRSPSPWAFHNRGVVWMAKGDYDRATADFGEAIRLFSQLPNSSNYPPLAISFYDRGITQYFQGHFDAAIWDFADACRVNPKCAFSPIWRGLALFRSGKDELARSQWKQTTNKFAKGEWPEPVMDLWSGQIDLPAFLKAAENPDAKKRGAQLCQADFYLGEYHLINGRQKEARTSLQSAEQECPKTSMEYVSAVAELKRLVH